MNKHTYTTEKLAKGEVHIYDFGTAKLHAYKTNDFLDNEVFIVEQNGQGVVIESPCFLDNIQELTDYLKGVQIAGMLIAYHGAGATFLPEVPKYGTRNAVAYSENGGGKALIDQFKSTFGEAFDGSVHHITHIIEEGQMTIGGIDFLIRQTADAFDVEIPVVDAVYTHMLGHDCHSIVAGAAHADASMAEWKRYIDKGYTLVLTSHYTPEDLKDVHTKIEYLEDLKKVAQTCSSAAAFKTEMQNRYPHYSGENYLDMTAGFFFP